MRQCKAFSERGFSVATFRGKFSLADTEARSFAQNSTTAKCHGDEALPEESDSTQQSIREHDMDNDISGAESPTEELAAGGYPRDNTVEEELYDPKQVPLLAAVGWEGDGGESASLSCCYLTLWNISTGRPFLRLKTPALQVISLEWYGLQNTHDLPRNRQKMNFVPLQLHCTTAKYAVYLSSPQLPTVRCAVPRSQFFAYQLTTSGSRHIRLWTAVQTFTGLKLKVHPVQISKTPVYLNVYFLNS